MALVGCSELPPDSVGLSYRHEGTVTTTVTLLKTPQGVLGSAEFVVPAGVNVHAYSETEFTSGVHEAFFKLEDGLELSAPIPNLTGPIIKTLTLGPLPPGSRPCYTVAFAGSSGSEVPELLELSGCVSDG